MTDITSALVKELRKRTGAGIMECKKALIEEKGNIELAIDNMRKSGRAKTAKKAGCITTEGVILIRIAKDSKYGVISELNCETDFVAEDSDFKAFGDELIETALNERISNIETLKAKFEEKRTMLVAKISENVNIRRFSILEGDMVGSYLHRGRIGVIISTTGANEELVKHIAMHIAANKPECIKADDVPADIITREHQIQMDIAMKLGKSRKITEKMVEGRMRKFTRQIALTSQQFVMDPNKTVGQLLSEYGAKVNNFIRFEVGEGIKTVKVNFSTEVSAIMGNKQF